MNYVSERKYRVWRYFLSNNVLLIRSMKLDRLAIKYSENEQFTIDLQFTGVTFSMISTTLNGLTLQRLIHSNVPEYITKYISDTGKVFELTSEGKKYYILATNCIVGKSQMESDENVLDSPFINYDEIITKFL